MTYQVKIGKRVRKAMSRFPRADQEHIVAKIKALAEDPRPPECRPIAAVEKGTYRVRVGDYRVIYVVLDDEPVVIVVRVVRRSEHTCQRLR